ncbi:MAG: helix-turn-helix transcriptional regulator, partial [Chloroflexi bacterium]|nr:helix-turn-helix transcriptional regulator [Chloroflexota bacterium]
MTEERHFFGATEERLAEARRQIVKTACPLFIKRGYDRTSMEEVAEAFRLTKGGLY